MAQGDAIRVQTAAGLQRSLQRLGRNSSGDWKLVSVELGPGTLASALAPYDGVQTAAVHMYMGDLPLTGVLAANPADLEAISKAFTGHAYPRGPRITPAEEVMLTELGNILINVLVNVLLNSLKRSLLPALPYFSAGGAAELAAAIPAATGPSRLLEARIALHCGGPAAELHLFALISEETARLLD